MTTINFDQDGKAEFSTTRAAVTALRAAGYEPRTCDLWSHATEKAVLLLGTNLHRASWVY